MPDQLPVDPIARLKQNIAALEEKQRIEVVDLSAEIQSLRALLAMLEHPMTTASKSGGITATAERVDIGGDAVGQRSTAV